MKLQITNCDCLKGLKNLEDNSIHCIITDPPYFIDGMDDNWNSVKLNKKVKKANVIPSLPIGMRFDPEQGVRLQKFIEEVSKELYRVLMPGGFFLCFSQSRLYHRVAIAIENIGFEIRDMFIWKKEGQAKAFTQTHFVKKMKISQTEKNRIIKSLNNRKTPQLKPQSEAIVFAQKPKEGTFVNNWLKWDVGLVDTTVTLDGKFPGTVMEVAKVTNKGKTNTHLTVKPERLIQHLIGLFTKPGQTVLDPFLGSGTTAVACIATNRKCIGFEINKKYYNICNDRIRKELLVQKH